jgi:thioredoxin-like negative regulator of GroEL
MAQTCKPNVLQMTAGEAKRFLEASDKPTLVQFAADWCGYCEASKPAVAQASQVLCDRARVVRVNVDKAPKLADRFKVEELPDFVVMHKGKIVARVKGQADAKTLIAAVNKAFQAKRRGR